MAELTSKSTVRPCATAPAVASAGPSIAGCVFQVMVRSFQPQSVIGWMRPPETLWALVTFATCNRKWAPVTCRVPTPATRTRRNVRCLAGPASALSSLLVPKFVVALSDVTEVSASTTAAGAPVGQTSGGPPTHVPFEQVSAVVHILPSSQAAALAVCTHPVAGSHESLVQTLPSSQARVFAACTHPTAGSHESVVQALPSSQASGGPPWHAPSAHVSCAVQGFPSSHAAVLGAMVQSPVAGSQESVVQTLPSSQLRAAVWTQPSAGSHESVVHRLWSSQSSGAPPTQVPVAQVSPAVQALPSWHGFALKPTTWHVPVPLQVPSSVQTLASLQAQPPCSKKQTAEQQSPLTVLPSSHSSPGSTTPLPQRAPTATPPLPSPNLAPVICARRKATMSSCNGESSASNACAAATASE